MAVNARKDQENREVEVNRLELIAKLESNLEKHLFDYEEAMAGYRGMLLEKIDAAFEEAKRELADKHVKIKGRISAFTDADIAKQPDHFTLIERKIVEMKVPKSYADEYKSAIDMSRWDVRETLELSYAEFTCFVRDQWDWKSDFDLVNATYSNVKLK